MVKAGKKEGDELKQPEPSVESAEKKPEKVQPETVPPKGDTTLVTEVEKRQTELQAEIDRKEGVIQKLKERIELQKKDRKTTVPLVSTSQLDMLEMTAQELEETSGSTTRVGEIKRQIVAERKRIAEEQYTRWQQSVIDGHGEEIESALAEVGMDWDSDDAKGVKKSFEEDSKTGDFSRTYFKLNQAINKGKKQASPGDEKKPEPEDAKKMEKEIERRALEKAGLLETDLGSPSGASAIFEQVRADFIKNPSNPAIRERYMEMRKERNR